MSLLCVNMCFTCLVVFCSSVSNERVVFVLRGFVCDVVIFAPSVSLCRIFLSIVVGIRVGVDYALCCARKERKQSNMQTPKALDLTKNCKEVNCVQSVSDSGNLPETLLYGDEFS